MTSFSFLVGLHVAQSSIPMGGWIDKVKIRLNSAQSSQAGAFLNLAKKIKIFMIVFNISFIDNYFIRNWSQPPPPPPPNTTNCYTKI